ncbi:hypothetical protein DFJ74DRAFT_661884 [Hyaloraphidium curvatum]|nr:hypothetical protein DFJ74DRAFT_661884 [Hyaloraphidium curvatum]
MAPRQPVRCTGATSPPCAPRIPTCGPTSSELIGPRWTEKATPELDPLRWFSPPGLRSTRAVRCGDGGLTWLSGLTDPAIDHPLRRDVPKHGNRRLLRDLRPRSPRRLWGPTLVRAARLRLGLLHLQSARASAGHQGQDPEHRGLRDLALHTVLSRDVQPQGRRIAEHGGLGAPQRHGGPCGAHPAHSGVQHRLVRQGRCNLSGLHRPLFRQLLICWKRWDNGAVTWKVFLFQWRRSLLHDFLQAPSSSFSFIDCLDSPSGRS